VTLRIAVLVAVLGACGFHPSIASDGQGSGDDGQGSGSADAGTTVTGPCGTVGAIRDDFDDGITAPMWNVVTNGVESGGVLVVTPTVTAPPLQFIGYLAKHSIDLTGEAVTVEVTGMVDTGSIATGALYLVSDKMNYVTIYQRTGMLVVEIGAPGPITAVSVPYDPVQQRWWRIAEAGGMVSFYASPDGVTWNALPGATPTPNWITRGRIALGGSTDGNHGSVSFDNLNQDTTPAGWCKPGVLVDKFQRTMLGLDWDAHVSMPSGCMPAVSNGARFDQNGMPDSRCWLTTREGFDLTGDHVMAYIPALTNRPTGWLGFLRVVPDDINDAFLIQYDSGQLCAQVQSKPEVCIAYASADTYWRISESGGTLTFDTSSDAVVWSVVAAIQVLFSVSAVDVEIGTATTTGFSPTANYVLDAYNSGP
jgi:hypothetical protein